MQARKSFIVTFVVLLVLGLLLQPAAAQTVPTVLPFGEIIQEYVNGAQMSHQYRFSALQDQTVFLMAASQDYEDSLNVVVSNQLTTENIMMAKLGVSGMCLRIVPGDTDYVLNVIAQNPQQVQWYGLMLMTGDPENMACSEENFNLLASMATTADGSLLIDSGIDLTDTSCLAVSNTGTGITIQSNPNVDSPSGITVGVDAPVAVSGSVDDGALLLINDNGTTGLVSASGVTVGGDCTNVPVVTLVGETITETNSLIDLITGVVSTVDPNTADLGLVDLGSTVNNVDGILEPIVGDVENTVGTVVGGSGGSTDPIVNNVTNIVEPVVDTVVGDTTDPVGDTSGIIDPVIDTVEDLTNPGPGTDANVTGPVDVSTDGGSTCINALGIQVGC